VNRIGIDLGGTKIEGVLLDNENSIINKKRIDTQKNKGYNFIFDSISSIIQEMSSISTEETKIGIGINGTFMKKTGIITHSSTDCLIGKSLKTDLETKLDKNISLENDANCFAMAEAILGSGKEYNSVFGVIIGTGVGAGIVIDKKLFTGKSGLAGEWGHHSIDPNGKKCYCGNVGCVDTFISGPSLENRWYELNNQHASLKKILGDSSNIHFKQWKSEFLEKFSVGLSNAINIIDPDVVVIGGGLSNIPFLYDEGKIEVHKKIVGHSADTPIVSNQLGDSSGVIGAALLN
jgi:fructokinase